MLKMELKKRKLFILIVVFLSMVVFFPILIYAQERVIAERHASIVQRPAQKFARVLHGPDSNAIYLQLQAGDPAFVKPSQKYEYWTKEHVMIRMSGFSSSKSPGDPMLPFLKIQIALPPEAEPNSLKLEVMRVIEEEITKPYRICPAPPYSICQPDENEKTLTEREKWGEGKNIVQGENTLVYRNDALYPAENSFIAYGGQLRKWKVANVTFYPLRYNPVRNRLFYARQVDLKINFIEDSTYFSLPGVEALMRDQVFDDEAKKRFLNFDQAKKWYQRFLIKGSANKDNPGDHDTDGALPDPDYAIITTDETFTGSEALLDFCYHKENLGYEIVVVTEDQVQSVEGDLSSGYSLVAIPGVLGYENVPDVPVPGQRPEKIRKWLQDYYATLGIKYVLLIGNPDPDNIQERDLVGDLSMADCWINLIDDVPTDFYFADLTGNWNLDNDAYVGEMYPEAGESNLPAGVTPELFSACWNGVLEVTGATEETNVYIYGDTDGIIEIWLDLNLDGTYSGDDEHIYQHLEDSYVQYFYSIKSLTSNYYPIKIEYHQSTGDAYCDIWPRCYTSGVSVIFKHYDTATDTYEWGLIGQYYNNATCSGTPVAEETSYPYFKYIAGGDRGVDGVDIYAEVVVGRIPVYDEDLDGVLDYDTLDDILNKIVDYENTDITEGAWRRRVLTSMPAVADYYDGVYHVSFYMVTDWIEQYIAPEPLWDWWKIYGEIPPVPADVTECSIDATIAGWNDPVDPDDGRGIVLWYTHGLQYRASEVLEDYPPDHHRCSELDDSKPTIVFMAACYNGKPEVTPYGDYFRYPLGYSNLKNGAIATVSASRTSRG